MEFAFLCHTGVVESGGMLEEEERGGKKGDLAEGEGGTRGVGGKRAVTRVRWEGRLALFVTSTNKIGKQERKDAPKVDPLIPLPVLI